MAQTRVACSRSIWRVNTVLLMGSAWLIDALLLAPARARSIIQVWMLCHLRYELLTSLREIGLRSVTKRQRLIYRLLLRWYLLMAAGVRSRLHQSEVKLRESHAADILVLLRVLGIVLHHDGVPCPGVSCEAHLTATHVHLHAGVYQDMATVYRDLIAAILLALLRFHKVDAALSRGIVRQIRGGVA